MFLFAASRSLGASCNLLEIYSYAKNRHDGKLEPNIGRAKKYKAIMKAPLYVIALEERKYKTIFPEHTEKI